MTQILDSDGNGNFVIPKWFFTIILLLMMIVSTVAAIVAANVTTKNEVNKNSETITELKQDSKDQDNRIDELEKTIPVINEKLKNIERGNDKILAHLGVIG